VRGALVPKLRNIGLAFGDIKNGGRLRPSPSFASGGQSEKNRPVTNFLNLTKHFPQVPIIFNQLLLVVFFWINWFFENSKIFGFIGLTK
jgi:hypothetical protein